MSQNTPTAALTALTLTDNLALFAPTGAGRMARTWARKGETVEVELGDAGGMWRVRRDGRDYVAVPRVVMAATA